MGRSRRGSGSGFTRSSSAKRTTSPPPPPPRQQAPPPMGQHGAGGMPMQSRGPSMMGTMAAAMGGSMLGNAISHQMFSAPQPTSESGVQEMKKVMEDSPCAVQFDMYSKCMEHNNNDAGQCQWAWDTVAQCRTAAQQQAASNGSL